MRPCPKCGEENTTSQRTCRLCYNAYMREYMAEYARKRKAEGLELLGGTCVDCGSQDESILEFDHVDPAQKSFTITCRPGASREKFLAELAKCVLRCKPCHKERTRQQQSVGHGEGVSGKRNCRCPPCRQRKAEWSKNYNAVRRARRRADRLGLEQL